jgi:type I restriction enzyme, S subunit
MSEKWPRARFSEFLVPNRRPYQLGVDQDANLVGMRLYGLGPFHREYKVATNIAKKSHFVIKAGDIIYNKLFAWKGTFGIVPAELDGMFVSDKFPTYELDRTICDENYLRWYFRYPPLWEEARVMSTGSASLSKLTLNPPKFLLLTIPLPPIKLQRRLVEQVEEISVQIDRARIVSRETFEATNKVIRSALYGISQTIKVDGILMDVLRARPRNGWSPRCENAENGIAVLSLGAITGFRYRHTEFKRTSLPAANNGHFWLKPGDLLITRSNTPELLGHAAIYDGEPTPCIYSDLMMRLETNDLVDRKFVWYWLQTPLVREYINKNAKGTSPTMKKISQGIVASIPFPSSLLISDQRRIVKDMDNLQTQVDALKRLQEETVVELDTLFPSILDRTFKGES